MPSCSAPLARLHSQPASQRWRVLATLALLVLLAALQSTSWAQPSFQRDAALDPPGQVARLNLAQGAVSFAPAEAAGYTGGNAWMPAPLNRPLTHGDRLWTGPRARAELHVGSTAVRMDEQTSLDFLALDDSSTQLRLAQGTLQLRVRALFEGQRLEVDTPNLAFVVSEPGDYRLDVNLARDTTRVVVQSGSGLLYGDSGASLPLGSRQQASFGGTALTVGPPGAGVLDGFDQWAAERDRREDQSVSARYVSREIIGYQQLDNYGDWQQDPAYGAVWLPRAVPVNWAPYRAGHWDWIAPWGWTWVDDAPWGFAPFHYGRWAQIGPRWAWVPGRLPARPVYAPALVAFVGGGGGGHQGGDWRIGSGTGRLARPALGWFPLAPGEAFRPAYQASPRYVGRVNNSATANTTVNATHSYRYQRQPDAVTVVSRDDFARGRPPMLGLLHAPSAIDLGRAQLLADHGALPQRVERPELREQRLRLAPAALPPAAVAAQAVVQSRGEQRGRDGPRFPARQNFLNFPTPPALPERAAEQPNDPRAGRPEGGERPSRRLQLPAPAAPATPAPPAIAGPAGLQPPAVRALAAPAPERPAPDAEAPRLRREQPFLQQEPQRRQAELAQQQQQQQQDQQRRQAEAAQLQQRATTGPAQRPPEPVRPQPQTPQPQFQQPQPFKDLLRAQTPAAISAIPAPPDARVAAERGALEQLQRAQQLQRDQQQHQQQMESARQQEQQRRQIEEAAGRQRAMQEQARQPQIRQPAAVPQQAQRQAGEPPGHPLELRKQQPAAPEPQARPAEAVPHRLRGLRPEGEAPRNREP